MKKTLFALLLSMPFFINSMENAAPKGDDAEKESSTQSWRIGANAAFRDCVAEKKDTKVIETKAQEEKHTRELFETDISIILSYIESKNWSSAVVRDRLNGLYHGIITDSQIRQLWNNEQVNLIATAATRYEMAKVDAKWARKQYLKASSLNSKNRSGLGTQDENFQNDLETATKKKIYIELFVKKVNKE